MTISYMEYLSMWVSEWADDGFVDDGAEYALNILTCRREEDARVGLTMRWHLGDS